ncbi:MAG: hydantoinase B/oxoprolinase family protein, partial [Alphaproteobacteria bacterium]|nr:hydantoinase B/oxoprolinase family protein [Alphaproteobacteria bacterium]
MAAVRKKRARARAGEPKRLDPVLLEIMRHKVEAIADEICITLLRTCRSVFVNEAADFAVAMVDLDGQVFGWAPENKTTAVNVPATHTIRAIGELEPGDAIVTNDPYSSDAMATHLPDLHVIRPYFHGRKLVAYGWGFIHYMDVGGRFPGSISAYNTDIFQEGFRIPPMKLMRRGKLNPDFVTLFKANCRLPETNMSDLQAMLGALEVGGRRVSDTIAQYGVDTFIACQRALKDYAAEKAQAVLRLLPDGDYDFWDYLDDDLHSPYPVRVRVRMTVKDGRVHFDLSGTDPQVDASYNLPTAGKLHNMLTRRLMTFIRTHDPTIPLNAGTFRPLSATNPPGTILNAEFPDACGVRFATATSFNDAVTGLLLKAAPEKMAGPTCGTGFSIVANEPSEDGGAPKVIVAQVARGGMSAYHGHDGVDARDVTMNTMFNHPLEVVEGKCALVFRDYDIRTDSGGPGSWRGGVGQLVTFEASGDGLSLLVRGMDRLRFPP